MSMAEVRGRFAGKVAVVTGGASGIGLAIVRGLHREGARIVCADIN
jgi:meso-butanediol dehydrogenase/(S,S)-butanediol dehydrogenase/diacetyl reductase